MRDDVYSKVKNFVVKEAAVNESEVFEDASLENDLGIHGDDAVDFIISFGKEFKVDVSKFMAADYFSGEGIDIIGPIIRMATGRKEKQRKDLKVRHLVKAVLAGSLNEEVINN
jgi:acyl carrier protein